MREAVVFHLNGRRIEVGADQARQGWMMVGDFLRLHAGLVGTKIVCAEGDCGACTVLVARPSVSSEFVPLNSCIYPVAQLDGCSVVTVDGLATDGKLTPVQQSMLSCHGSQCGYCTPGFVMAMTGLVEKRAGQGCKRLEAQETKNALTGNLCRCTGYQPIIDAACSLSIQPHVGLASRFLTSQQAAELKAVTRKPIHFRGPGYEFYAPRSLKDGAQWLRKNPDATLVSGGTDLGVTHNKRKRRLSKILSLHCVPGLSTIQKRPKGRLRVGGAVTLTSLREATQERAPEFAKFLDLFASPQIKNVATLAGNVANASPIADTPPFLLISGAVVEVQGPSKRKRVPIEKFFLGYRKTALAQSELIEAIEFDLAAADESLRLYKVSQRKDLDISTVSAALRFRWDTKTKRIAQARIAFGGVAATPVRFPKTEKLLRGLDWSRETLERAQKSLQGEMKPIGDLRGSAAFRRVAAGRLLERFFRETSR